MAAPIKFGVGQSVLRKEDDALIRGKGRYTDDHSPQPALHALMLRSPHAHAKFTINVAKARGMPGVGAVLTADDVKDLGDLPCLFNFEVDPFTGPPYPILAKDEVRHVGDSIAFVVADTIDQARDALEAIEVNWTPLPAVVGILNAVKKGAPQVWPKHDGNVLFDVPIGDKKATEAVFAKAHAVAEVTIVNPRVITNFMETRAAVAEYDAKRDHLTLTIGSQGSHRLREIIGGMVLKMPLEKMRVICPDVGGGFGTKLFPYREYALISVAAKKLKKTIKWTADRSDHFMGDAQGRDNVTTAKMALAEDGKFLGDGRRPDRRHGRLSVDLRSLHPAWRRRHAAGPLRHPDLPLPRPHRVHQHRAGRCLSRRGPARGGLRDRAAGGRRRAKTRHDARCDQAQEFHLAEGDALQDHHRQGLRFRRFRRAHEARDGRRQLEGIFEARQGRQEGGPGARHRSSQAMSRSAAPWAKRPPMWRSIPMATSPILIGTQSSGQGHQTAYAQLIAEQFGLPPERVHILQGDTDQIATGLGTGGSASIPTGGVSVQRAAHDLGGKLKEIAAEALETSAGDLEISDGRIRIAGTDRAISFADLAKRPGVDPSKLNASATFDQADGTYPNGTHLAEVEIDPGDRHHQDRQLRHRRRFRGDAQSAAARRPGPWRRDAGDRPGPDGAGGIRQRRSARHRHLHGLRDAARGRRPVVPFRDPQRSLHDQSVWA